MPRIAILNMSIGFALLAFSASAGSFIGLAITNAFLKDPQMLGSWSLMLLKSAHGHTNLFGMVHVMFGLTIPYAHTSERVQKWQTIGILLGSMAMAIGMPIRAGLGPTENIDVSEALVGSMLVLSVVAIAWQAYALFLSYAKR